jgi:hypothetical protein
MRILPLKSSLLVCTRLGTLIMFASVNHGCIITVITSGDADSMRPVIPHKSWRTAQCDHGNWIRLLRQA